SAFAGLLPQVLINLGDSLGLGIPDSFDHLLIEEIGILVIARRRFRLQSVAQVAARDKGYASARGSGGAVDARAEAQMVFVGEEAVAQGDDWPAPAVRLQEIERPGRPTI